MFYSDIKRFLLFKFDAGMEGSQEKYFISNFKLNLELILLILFQNSELN